MTTEAFTQTVPYTISGTGPYNIGHAYTDGAIVAKVQLADGSVVVLVAGVDFSVLPLAGDDGDVTLSGAAATAYDGETLLIRRRTRAEQGFAGQNAREKGLEANIDQMSMLTQEHEWQTYRAIRIEGASEINPYAPQDGRPPIWDEANKRFINGPDQAEVAAAQANALKARQWAEENEDVEVETGEYSAKHHSAKSAAAAVAAAAAAASVGRTVPVGSVFYLATLTPPAGYLKANGAAVSRATYAALFAAIGTTYGVGDGSTTFNLPDLRGEFLRGLDDGRGVDAGRALGSAQAQEIQAHPHSVDPPVTATSQAGSHNHIDGGGAGINGGRYGFIDTGVANANIQYDPGVDGRGSYTSTAPDHGHTVDIPAFMSGSAGGSETRPRNIALLPVIAY